VYCLSKPLCKSLAQELNCAHYHADVDNQAEQLQEWVEQGRLIIATSALRTGVDYAGIVYILHIEMP
jgi:superfamily II DNA helicase RecQ